MSVQNGIRRIVFGKKGTSQSYIDYLRQKGVWIGEGTTFFSPHQSFVDVQYPWMIEIGENVQITAGVRILTHDYSWSVTKKKYGPVLGLAGEVHIGNNVFIGTQSILLPGTYIGDDVIIGAGSVVKGRIPSQCVAVGNPCHKVMELETYYQKCREKQIQSTKLLAQSYYRHTHQIPPEEVFHEYFFLFKEQSTLTNKNRQKMKLTGNYEKTLDVFKRWNRPYFDFEEFIKDALKK